MKRTFRAFALILLSLITVSIHPNAQASTVLNIVNHYNVADQRTIYMTEYFEEQAPTIRLRFSERDIDPSSLSFLSKATDIDLIYLYRSTLMAAAKAGALFPLSDDPELVSNYTAAGWLPFEPLLSYDSQLYGIPFLYLPDILSFDEKLAKEYDFVLPQQPYTWTDLANAWYHSNASASPEIYLLQENIAMPGLLMQYLSEQYYHTGTVDFSASSFRQSLTAYAMLVRNHAVVDYEPQCNAMLSRTSYLGTPAFYPQAGSEFCVIVDMYAFSIPRKSKHTPEAMAFLKEYAKIECQGNVLYGNADYMMLKNPDLYTRYDRYDICMPENYDEEVRQYISEHWVPRFSVAPFIQYVNHSRILNDYYAGTISIDDLCNLLQEKIDRMLLEQ